MNGLSGCAHLLAFSLSQTFFAKKVNGKRYQKARQQALMSVYLPLLLDPRNAQDFPFAYSREERLHPVRALECHQPAGEVDRWAARFLPADDRIGTITLLRRINSGRRRAAEILTAVRARRSD